MTSFVDGRRSATGELKETGQRLLTTSRPRTNTYKTVSLIKPIEGLSC